MARIDNWMQWDDIRVFLALAAAGKQKAAGKVLDIDQATVGRRIKALQESLGIRLFDKRSDGFVLTAAGQQFLSRAREVESLISDIERDADALDPTPRGVIRLAMPGGMANHWLIPKLKPFFRSYPDIRIEFLTSAEVVNLWKREADVAIRLVEPKQKELFYRKLTEIKLSVYASKALLSEDRKGKSIDPKELPFIALFDRSMSAAERSLLEKIGPFPNVTCCTHAWSSVYYAVQAGLGIGILPDFYAENDRTLVELPDLPTVKAAAWLVMHPDVKGSGRIKALTSFLLKL